MTSYCMSMMYFCINGQDVCFFPLPHYPGDLLDLLLLKRLIVIFPHRAVVFFTLCLRMSHLHLFSLLLFF